MPALEGARQCRCSPAVLGPGLRSGLRSGLRVGRRRWGGGVVCESTEDSMCLNEHKHTHKHTHTHTHTHLAGFLGKVTCWPVVASGLVDAPHGMPLGPDRLVLPVRFVESSTCTKSSRCTCFVESGTCICPCVSLRQTHACTRFSTHALTWHPIPTCA